jgi:hypothetical protein
MQRYDICPHCGSTDRLPRESTDEEKVFDIIVKTLALRIDSSKLDEWCGTHTIADGIIAACKHAGIEFGLRYRAAVPPSINPLHPDGM